MRWLILLAIVQLLVVGTVTVLLSQRRIALLRARRRREQAMDRLRGAAIALIVDGRRPAGLSRDEQELLAEVLWSYSRQITGESRANIAAYFEETGLVDRLLRSVRDRRAWCRAAAAYSLGDTCSPRAVPALIEALRDDARPVRTAAARSIGRLRATAAAEPLALAMAARSVPLALAGTMMLSLGSAALPALRRLLAHHDPHLRVLGLRLISLVGDAGDAGTIRPFRHDADPSVRAQACLALTRLGAADAAAVLRPMLDDPHPAVRAAAAEGLGELGDTAAVPALLAQARRDLFEPAHAAAYAAARVDAAAANAAARGDGAGPHLHEATDVARARL